MLDSLTQPGENVQGLLRVAINIYDPGTLMIVDNI
jgi:hypothetical protein